MVAAPQLVRVRAPIAVLPREIAERIAAGEVVERPASVVRELVDNAVDAGAHEINVELRGGGLELIRVSDDGIGIPPDQVELAFQRHATSKLVHLEDLSRLETLGFRGEALPSIAAVSETTVLTRDAESDAGATVTVRGGVRTQRNAAARQVGTTVSVRRLFYNVPARLKFLPTSRHESMLVSQLIRRYALAHPEMRLSLVLDGHLSFRASGSGRLDRAMAEVYGLATGEAMLPLGPLEVGRARVSGRIGSRSATRPGRTQQTLVVNGRCVTNRELLAAMEAAYRPLLPRGRHPLAVVVLDVPPDEVDPNVHPAKSEVRLAHEREISTALADVIRGIYARLPVAPAEDENFSLVSPQLRLTLTGRVGERRGPTWGQEGSDSAQQVDVRRLRVVGQLHQSLILAEGNDGLYLVDQHRAHERALFERLAQDARGGSPYAQALLEPIVISLRSHQAATLSERIEELERLGFQCERFGERDFLVRAVPVVPGSEDFVPYLEELLGEAAGQGERWNERLMTLVACRAAIRRERPLNPDQMEHLLHGLAETSAPAVCPHGSPLILHVSGGFLERQFNW
jgi:DNA mismatch repair protein MutL